MLIFLTGNLTRIYCFIETYRYFLHSSTPLITTALSKKM